MADKQKFWVVLEYEFSVAADRDPGEFVRPLLDAAAAFANTQRPHVMNMAVYTEAAAVREAWEQARAAGGNADDHPQ